MLPIFCFPRYGFAMIAVTASVKPYPSMTLHFAFFSKFSFMAFVKGAAPTQTALRDVRSYFSMLGKFDKAVRIVGTTAVIVGLYFCIFFAISLALKRGMRIMLIPLNMDVFIHTFIPYP